MDPIFIQRRKVLQALFYGAGAAALSACGGSSSSARSAAAALTPEPTDSPLPPAPTGPEPLAAELPLTPGPLADIGPLAESEVPGILIPEGFSIRPVARHLENPMTGLPDPLGLGGYNWHSFPDGGAVFPVEEDGGWVYVSNSEVPINGGVGALRFDADGRLMRAYSILRNTRTNCAGGPTPWGTWLSCEEVSDGLVYECHPLGTPSQAQVRPALGVFRHEAAAVDWKTRTVYLTEDRGDGRFYRFRSAGLVSSMTGKPSLDLDNGELEVLEVDGFENGAYQEDATQARRVNRVKWVPVIDPHRPQETVRREIEHNTGAGAPGTRFRGGEGLWIQELPPSAQPPVLGADHPLRAVVFFACKGDNRVLALDVDNDLLEVVFDNEQLIGAGEDAFDDVDNLVVSPAGDVIVAEDGDMMRLMVMIPNQPAKILLQILGGGSELTGPAFTADGSRLYFSDQRGMAGLGSRTGVTYELTIPESFRQPRSNVPSAMAQIHRPKKTAMG